MNLNLMFTTINKDIVNIYVNKHNYLCYIMGYDINKNIIYLLKKKTDKTINIIN